MSALTNLAKECEYLEEKAKEIEAIEIVTDLADINRYRIQFEDKELELHPLQAQEMKEAILTIITHGVARVKKDIRGEL